MTMAVAAPAPEPDPEPDPTPADKSGLSSPEAMVWWERILQECRLIRRDGIPIRKGR
jgi:hypothetical protein